MLSGKFSAIVSYVVPPCLRESQKPPYTKQLKLLLDYKKSRMYSIPQDQGAIMENPIRAARRSLNLTQRSLAEQAGISPTAVLRYEQGLYEEVSSKIYKALLEHDALSVSIVDLPAYYRAWRTQHQYEASKYFNPLPAMAVNLTEHPFVTFRRTITTRAVGKDSRISFCILLAIHPSVVLDYEAGKQEHMPNLIKQALVNAGVNGTYLNGLDQLGGVYYDRRVTSSGR